MTDLTNLAIHLPRDGSLSTPAAVEQYHGLARGSARAALNCAYFLGEDEIAPGAGEVVASGGRALVADLAGWDARLWREKKHVAAGPTVGIYPTVERAFRTLDVEWQYIDHIADVLGVRGEVSPSDSQRIEDLARCLDFSDLIVTGSETCRRQVIGYFGAAPERVVALSCAPTFCEDSARLDDHGESALGRLIVVFMPGATSERAGRSAHALAAGLRAAGLPVRLVVARDGPQRDHKPGWAGEFDVCVSVGRLQRQWLFRQAAVTVMIDDGGFVDTRAVEAQYLCHALIMPLCDGYQPVRHALAPSAHAACSWYAPGDMDEAVEHAITAFRSHHRTPALSDAELEHIQHWRESDDLLGALLERSG